MAIKIIKDKCKGCTLCAKACPFVAPSALFNYNVISENQVSTLNLIIGIVLAILIALILLGGIKRIGQVTEKLVPFMAVMYIVLAIGVVLLNVKNVPTVFASIFEGAFNPASVTGGVVGSFFMSMKKGVSRGIFSNEAGLGTGSIAHACAHEAAIGRINDEQLVKLRTLGMTEEEAEGVIIENFLN